ncbi:MAG: polysaccharide biosynthesis protein, partial [Nostoc sp.]
LIRLSGYEVNKDIEIVFTGLRPGEKLFEELFIEGEEYEPTQHEKLLIVKNSSRTIPVNLNFIVDDLQRSAYRNDRNSIIFLLEQLIPEYKSKYSI